jgi:hypothetical protein
MTDKTEKANDNKDYVINLRVSRATYEKLKSKAAENRDTLSGFVRKAIDDSAEIISDLSNDVFGKRKKDFGNVDSYHEVEVAKNIKCAQCGEDIPAGETATVGETKSGRKYYFCGKCRS